MLDKKVVLIGYSGHGMVVADAAMEQGLDLRFYSEKKAVKMNPFALEYIGFEQEVAFDWERDLDFILGIGNNVLRLKVATKVLENGKRLLNVIHPTSTVSSKAQVGSGNFFNSGAAINALSAIGDLCIVNTGAIIEHECILGKGVHIAPGAVLAGGVKVGAGSFIGANAVVKEGVNIGENVVIGAGAVILRDVPDNQKWVGNPGRSL